MRVEGIFVNLLSPHLMSNYQWFCFQSSSLRTGREQNGIKLILVDFLGQIALSKDRSFNNKRFLASIFSAILSQEVALKLS